MGYAGAVGWGVGTAVAGYGAGKVFAPLAKRYIPTPLQAKYQALTTRGSQGITSLRNRLRDRLPASSRVRDDRGSWSLLPSGSADDAANAGTDSVSGIPAAARTRPSFRRGTERDALASAPRAPDGGAMCPGCGTSIGRGQIEFGGRLRRDFDLDHYGRTWAERIREMSPDISRPEVIDEYQEMVRATCPICNQSHILEGR